MWSQYQANDVASVSKIILLAIRNTNEVVGRARPELCLVTPAPNAKLRETQSEIQCATQ
jgi:hypothetical protein